MTEYGAYIFSQSNIATILLTTVFFFYRAGYNPDPKKDCSRFCGNTSIPFPFGIEEGCYAHEKFGLNCTKDKSTVLEWGGIKYHVYNVSVADGYLSVRNIPNDTAYNFQEFMVPTKDGEEAMQGGARNDLFELSQEYDMQMWWAVRNITCQKAMKHKATYACRSVNSNCLLVNHGKKQLGYRCNCSQGFQGNPYIEDGCEGSFSHHTCVCMHALYVSINEC